VSRTLISRGDAKAPSRLRALPWAALLRAVVAIGRRWRELSDKDRARVTRIVRDSRGRLGNLSSKERAELRKLVRKMDLKGLGRDLLMPLRGRGRRKKRR
jgi:hypothetical protein